MKNNKSSNNIVYYIIFAIIIIIACYPYYDPKKEMIINKELLFYKTNIANKIKSIKDIGKGNSKFVLDNNDTFYIDISVQKEYMSSFHDVARIGDSIYKPAYSDTIYLYTKLYVPGMPYADVEKLYINSVVIEKYRNSLKNNDK